MSTDPGGEFHRPRRRHVDRPCWRALHGSQRRAIAGPGEGYRSNTPPMHEFIPILRRDGYTAAAGLLARAHQLDL
jgi:hypothetical protein